MTDRPLTLTNQIRDLDFNNSMQDNKNEPFEGDIPNGVKKIAATETKPKQIEEASEEILNTETITGLVCLFKNKKKSTLIYGLEPHEF